MVIRRVIRYGVIAFMSLFAFQSWSTSPLEYTVEQDKAAGKTVLDEFREKQLQRSSSSPSSEKEEVSQEGEGSDQTAR